MAEIIICPNPNCQEHINLETDIYRDENNNIYCKKCNTQILIK
jgi:aspartate carbamoyltransferase regulatory subunit